MAGRLNGKLAANRNLPLNLQNGLVLLAILVFILATIIMFYSDQENEQLKKETESLRRRVDELNDEKAREKHERLQGENEKLTNRVERLEDDRSQLWGEYLADRSFQEGVVKTIAVIVIIVVLCCCCCCFVWVGHAAGQEHQAPAIKNT